MRRRKRHSPCSMWNTDTLDESLILFFGTTLESFIKTTEERQTTDYTSVSR